MITGPPPKSHGLRDILGRLESELLQMEQEPPSSGSNAWYSGKHRAFGVVNIVVPMTDGSTMKFAEQLVPSHGLRPG
jgi:hypothetical protein